MLSDEEYEPTLDDHIKALAEIMDLSPDEVKKVTVILLLHNATDGLLNRLLGMYITQSPLATFRLERHLFSNIDFFKKVEALYKLKVIGKKLYNSLLTLNNVRVAIAHAKRTLKSDPKLKYKGSNILTSSNSNRLLYELNAETAISVHALIKQIENGGSLAIG